MIPQSEPASPQSPIPDPVFFDYTDLLFFVGLCVPCLLIAAALVRGVAIFVHTPASAMLLLVQSIWYFLAFGSIAALFRIRYGQPFWRALGWRALSFSGT